MKTKLIKLGLLSLSFPVLTQELENKEIELQEIVVTATRSERKLKDVPIPTAVISSKEIEKSKIGNFKDFLEQELAGITFSYQSGSPEINMLGLGAKYILFLIDGERMAGETFDNVDYNRINIDNIERIEILKGASSSLYGSNAIGGVINIITKKPKRDLESSVSTRFGSYNEQNITAFFGTKQKWGAVSLSGAYKVKNHYTIDDQLPLKKVYDNGLVENLALGKTNILGYYDYSINPKVNIIISPKINLDLSSNFYFKERNEGGINARTVREQYQDYSNAGRLNIRLAEQKNLTISGSYGIYEKFDYYRLLRQKNKKYENSIWRASVVYNQKFLRKHQLIFGGEFLSEELLSFMFNHQGTEAKRNVQTYSVFGQQEWTVSKDFTLVSGVRFDHHNEFKEHITWRFSGMYKIGESITLRGGYAGGFRSPTLKELYTDWYHSYGGGFQISGSTDLKVEKSHNFNFSSDFNFKKLNIAVVGQYSYIKDKITTIWQNQTRNSLKYVNLEDAKILSTEVLATYRFKDDLYFKGGYTFTHDFKEKQQQTRPHTLTARVEYTPNFIGKYAPMISFSGKYFSGSEIDETDRKGQYKIYYEPYSIWRLGIVFDLPLSFQVSAGLDNIFGYRPKFVSPYSPLTLGATYFVGFKWLIN